MLLTEGLGTTARYQSFRSAPSATVQSRNNPGLSLDLEESVEADNASGPGGDPQHAVARAAHEQQHEDVYGRDLESE